MPQNYADLKIIYHHPRPITERGISGSQVRPYKMLKAFRELGAEVREITGDASTRAKAMQQVREEIKDGVRFDFVYSENLTIPFAMSESHRLPLHPLLDHQFLSFCNSHGIPVSLFNRDAYWRDRSYKTMLPWWGRLVTIPLYWYDWWFHARYLTTLYLPSVAMTAPLPWMDKFRSVKFLPPGAEIQKKDWKSDHSTRSHLKVFYVGGIEPPYYDLRPLLAAAQQTESVHLTICCREKEWRKQKQIYQQYLTNRVTITHASGKQLDPLYLESDLLAVVRGPGSYLDYSVPIKIYEAIGYGTPILCTPGGETSRIVESENIGWVRPTDEIPTFLNHLSNNPKILEQVRTQIKNIQHQHTWRQRAIQVCNDLMAAQ